MTTGQEAETAAAEYLKRRGYSIIERNYCTPACEIDIIAERQKRLFFVEVKYRGTMRRVAASTTLRLPNADRWRALPNGGSLNTNGVMKFAWQQSKSAEILKSLSSLKISADVRHPNAG